jgi:cob(I)alamin adenosyltransferase
MTLPSAGRLLLSALLLSACSAKLPAELLTEVNQRVERVDRAGQSLAIGAARLPSRALTADDMAEVRALLDTYLRESDPLNASIRKLADAEPALDSHIRTVFRPAAESALSICQEASDSAASATSTSDDLAKAIARITACVERYSAAVTAVSVEVGRIAH